MDYEKKYMNARIPKRFWGVGLLDVWKDTDSDEDVAAAVSDYCAYLEKHRSDGYGMLLVGQPGLGKTMLACHILQAAIAGSFSALFLTMPELVNMTYKLRDLSDAWRIMKDEQAYNEWLRKDGAMHALRTEVDFLVLDDVGKEYTTTSGYTQALFDDIFRTRYNNSLPTIITTNVSPEKWDGRYSPAMSDFIQEACFLLGMEGSSYRSRFVHEDS